MDDGRQPAECPQRRSSRGPEDISVADRAWAALIREAVDAIGGDAYDNPGDIDSLRRVSRIGEAIAARAEHERRAYLRAEVNRIARGAPSSHAAAPAGQPTATRVAIGERTAVDHAREDAQARSAAIDADTATVREVQQAILAGGTPAVLYVQLGVLPSQFVRIAGELRMREMTVRDYLSEDDVERDRPAACEDSEIVEAFADGIAPYVYDPHDPAPRASEQQRLATAAYFAETQPGVDRSHANRMMGIEEPSISDLADHEDRD